MADEESALKVSTVLLNRKSSSPMKAAAQSRSMTSQLSSHMSSQLSGGA